MVLLLAGAALAPRLGDRWFTAAEKMASDFAKRKTAVLFAVAVSAILARLALLPLLPAPVPEVHDEFSYLLAADTFVHGRLTNPPHPMWVFFDTFHVLQQPTYMSIFPPGQGAVLAIGRLLGNAWIGVLLSAALMCAAVTWMLQGWFPAEWALLGGVVVLLRLGLFAYWVNSYWGGAVAATGGAMVMGALPRIIHHYRSRHALILALGMAVLANSRPVEGFIFCIPVAVALAIWWFSKQSPPVHTTARVVFAPLACVLLAMLGLMGYDNWRITGDAFVFPHVLYQEHHNFPWLAWQRPSPPLHYSNDQIDDFYNVEMPPKFVASWPAWRRRTWGKLFDLWYFFFGTLLSIPCLALPWVVRDRRMRLLLLQLLLSAAGLLAVFYVWPHYAAPLVATLFAVWVQAFRHLRRWRFFKWPIGLALSRMVVLAILGSTAFNAAQIRRTDQAHGEQWNVSRQRIGDQLNATPGLHLVIVHYQPWHWVHYEWVYNGADIDRSKVVWARDIPERDMGPLLAYFRNRKVWLVEADASPPRLQPYPGQ